MWKCPELVVAAALLLASPVLASDRFGLGRPALPEEVAAWDVDILPDGTGLPRGRGSVAVGEELFSEKCAACHGEFAEGVDNWPELAGGEDTLADEDPVKTVGSYWPYLSTVWDYVSRSMPYGAAQTLEPDEVYAIVAYILYSNDLVDEEFELGHETFGEIELPNAAGFIVDDRPVTEYAAWRGEPCMRDCKDAVAITMRAVVLDVTPQDEGTDAVPAVAAAPAAAPAAAAQPDPELVSAGKKVFRKCKACHTVGDDRRNRIGPTLSGVFGRRMGDVEGFRYSKVFRQAAEEGRVWDDAEMAGFLANPRRYLKGTKMVFAGLRKDADIEAVIAYIRSEGG